MRWIRLLTVVLVLVPSRAWAVEGVTDTVHNLSTSGPGEFRSQTVSQVCVFCHTPHNARPRVPLWNRRFSGATYIEYESSTLKARPGQPTGTSRLCLSCHDGTIALGALVNPPTGSKVDIARTFLTGRANLGTDLSDDHPVSFRYDNALRAANQQLTHPKQTGLPLQGDDLQCSSCHEPHENEIIPFLRRSTLNGALCTSCHDIRGRFQSWATSSHATSNARAGGTGNPWAERKPEWRGQTVAENACFNCHTPHNAVTPPRLIKDREEKTCFLCHDGGVAKSDVEGEIRKPYGHRVDVSTGVHDPAEEFVRRQPEKHVECADCHNPHVSDSTSAAPPGVPGSVAGVSGVDATGGPVGEAQFLYEVCYKCHGDTGMDLRPVVTRQILDLNTRTEFDLASPSYHPVQGIGRNTNVPSLVPPLRKTSLISCTDCHSNDNGPGAGGSGASGPHGSIYEGLLERNYATADNTAESPVAYDLCYKCHDRTSILADESFSEHRRHVVTSNTPCSACHDPHGVSSIRGNPMNNSHLINFDVTIAAPNARGQGPFFEDLGVFRGQCSLSCHGKDHDALGY